MPRLFIRAAQAAVLVAVLSASLRAAENDPASTVIAERQAAIREAIQTGLSLVQGAAGRYPEHKTCFSCHHQTLPLFAMREAQRAGFSIDEKLVKTQFEFTRESFSRRVENLQQGQHIGGWAATVTYGLWTYDVAGAEPDEISDAMLQYLMKTQGERGYWRAQSNRPPLEESRVAFTALALYEMKKFRKSPADEDFERIEKLAREYLATAPLESQEDANFRLWHVALDDSTEDDLKAARQAVLERQREDGGWPQLPEMDSDAYATGQSLYMLAESGHPLESPEFQRGVDYLLKIRRPDGSWHVKTRSKPVQVYFDNGDPHGKDQFISTPAACWAVAALARSLPSENGRNPR